jgi:type VI secretion system protein VasJ
MEVAAAIRAKDAATPLSYRYQRVGLWMALESLPSTEDGKTTLLGAPGEDVVNPLNQLLSAGNWLGLLNAAEDLTSQYYFWLDPHRYAALALEKLGSNFITAREMLCKEVMSLLIKFPNLVELTFSDGTPFADAATKQWIDDEAKKLGVGGGGGGAGAAAASAEDQELAARMEQARELVSTGKVPDGLALATALASRAADARMRFRGNLTVARMALDANKPDIARPMLESMLAQIDKHALEEWEPLTCAWIYGFLLSSYKSLNRPKEGVEPNPHWVKRESEVFDKLCKLDPAAALKIAGG